MPYFNLCHCKDPELKLDYSFAVFVHLFRGVVKIMLSCAGLKGAGFFLLCQIQKSVTLICGSCI